MLVVRSPATGNGLVETLMTRVVVALHTVSYTAAWIEGIYSFNSGMAVMMTEYCKKVSKTEHLAVLSEMQCD